jgi:hypothetical protein
VSGKIGPTFESLSKQLTAAQDRAHQSGERAAQQFFKFLGTVLGGFGIAIAAWLQRIFEQPVHHGAPSPLAWALAVALFFVALGLAALVLTAIIDQRSANHAARSTVLNTARAWNQMERAQVQGQRQGDEKSARELTLAVDDEDLTSKIEKADASARRLNTVSDVFGLGSWFCLIAAFISLGVGIVNTLLAN